MTLLNESNQATNSAAERAFFEAIRQGQAAVVREQVAADPALLDAYDDNAFGATPLTLVTLRDDRSMIETLLELGADPNRRSDWWAGPWSPLHCAIYAAKDELAEFLLRRGATLDVHTAASLGRIDELRALLAESPARVRELGGDGCQPLHFAGTVEAAQVLLDLGADIEARCVDHYSTPAQYLAHPRPEVATALFALGAEADIFSAVLAGATDVVEALLADDSAVLAERIGQERFPPGPDHDVHNIMTFIVGDGASPLHAAAKANRGAMIAQLVTAGIDVNVRGGYDEATPLHMAAWDDRGDSVRQLIASGADVNLRSGSIHNNSPAGWAIVAGSADAFEILMDNGSEVMDWFAGDARAAVAGEFRKYKVVPQENYERIAKRLSQV